MPDVENPFPMTLKDGRVVLDEECRCGKRRSEHATERFGWGHGPCPASGCLQFTFKDFVLQADKP